MEKTLGEYVDINSQAEEYLDISVSMSSLSVESDWRKNSLCAEFIAGYMMNVIAGKRPDLTDDNKDVKSAVNYIANELFENATKFNYAETNRSIVFRVQMEESLIRFFVRNSIDDESIEPFQSLIQRLLTDDPDDMYFERIEHNAESETDSTSGLGYLSMMIDYNASIAWKFESDEDQRTFVTTMIKIDV